MRGRCAIYKEDNPIRQFIISNEYEDGRRIVYHKYTGLRCGAYKRALNAHKKLWEEVMDEMENLTNCYVCERYMIEGNSESTDWCESCREKNNWRCESCDEIQYNKKYRCIGNDSCCKKCIRKYEVRKAEVIADWNDGGWLKAYELRQKQLASKKD